MLSPVVPYPPTNRIDVDPESSAKLVADLPVSMISFAVCSLISSVYFELLFGIEFSFPYAYGNITHSSFFTAVQTAMGVAMGATLVYSSPSPGSNISTYYNPSNPN